MAIPSRNPRLVPSNTVGWKMVGRAGMEHRTPKINAWQRWWLGRDRKPRFNWVASSSVVIIINQEISARPRNSRRFAWLRRRARWIIGVAENCRRGRVFSGRLIRCYSTEDLSRPSPLLVLRDSETKNLGRMKSSITTRWRYFPVFSFGIQFIQRYFN